MAAGLGTRMRSSTPKHLHPLLGRRMVDWVIAAAREAGADPRRRRRLARRRATSSTASRSRCRSSRSAPATPCAPRARALARRRGDVLVLSGDVPLLSAGAAARPRRDAPGRAAPRRRSSRSSRRIRAATVASSATARDGSARIVEAVDATPDELELREVNSSIYVFAAGQALAGARAARAAERAGRALPHRHDRHPRRRGRSGRGPRRARSGRGRGDQHARRARGGGRCAARPHQPRAHARRRDDRRPEHDLDRAGRRARGRRDDPSLHRSSAGRRGSRATSRSSPASSPSTRTIGAGVAVGPFCYLRPGTVLEAGAKAGTFVELKNAHIGEGAKVPHLSYLGDADVGAMTNIAAGNITANYPHEPGRGQDADADRA